MRPNESEDLVESFFSWRRPKGKAKFMTMIVSKEKGFISGGQVAEVFHIYVRYHKQGKRVGKNCNTKGGGLERGKPRFPS